MLSVLTGSKRKVFAFEPVTKNVFYIKRHLELNKIVNTTLIEKAVSDTIGILKFSLSSNPSQGHLSEEGEIEVETITLDEFIKQGNPYPDLIKMDIEGAEYLALKGSKEILKIKKPVIFLATHGYEVREKCLKLLSEFDYKITSLDNKEISKSDEFICY